MSVRMSLLTGKYLSPCRRPSDARLHWSRAPPPVSVGYTNSLSNTNPCPIPPAEGRIFRSEVIGARAPNGTSELPVGPKLARVVGHLFTLSFAGPSGHCIDLLTSAELTGLSFDVLRDDEVPCVHKGHSLGAASQRAFVRDHDQGETQVSPEPLEKLDDVVTGVFVEVAGGLVCQ
jgi:hypothetical protein